MQCQSSNKSYTNDKGFTLIEVLLYVVIASILLGVISTFVFMLIGARVKNQVISEVDTQGAFLSEIIERTITNAEGVNIPTANFSANSISINTLDSLLDPTVFFVSGDTFYIQEGVGSSVALSNSNVVVSDLVFYNLSLPSTPGSVQFSFKITHVNPENRNEFSYSKTFKGSASIR